MYRAISVYFVIAAMGAAKMLVGAPVTAAAQAPPPAAAPAPAEEPRPVLAVPPGYKYDARGRRDPFVNPVPKAVAPEPEIPFVRPAGLKGVLISEATIIGVVTSKETQMNLAVIQAPGGKTYFATPGDELFDAVIKQIQVDAVVFEVSAAGRQAGQAAPPREVVRKVRSSPGA